MQKVGTSGSSSIHYCHFWASTLSGSLDVLDVNQIEVPNVQPCVRYLSIKEEAGVQIPHVSASSWFSLADQPFALNPLLKAAKHSPFTVYVSWVPNPVCLNHLPGTSS